MPEFAAPWALVGLALIPLIRWLHHYRRQGPSVDVSAVFLWQGLRPDERGAMRTARPEAAWWRRAGIAGLVVLALADPRLPLHEAETVHVWWDHAPSMQALEQGRSRHAAAIERLLEAAAGSGVATLHLRALRGVEPPLELGATNREASRTLIEQWLDRLPPAVGGAPLPLLDPRYMHWLVSDGASADLSAWAALQPLNRVIAVGAATENIAITRLAARPAPGSNLTVAGIVLVHNAGQRSSPVELTVSTGEQIVHRVRLELAPAATVKAAFSVNTPPARLEARVRRLDGTLEPFGADDSLSLALASFAQPIPVLVNGLCPAAINRALAAHPRLVRATTSAPDAAKLQIACTDQPPSGGPPLLWLPRSQAATRLVSGDAYWLDAPPGGDARLPLGTPAQLAPPPGTDVGQAILAIARQPLAILRSDPRPAVTLLLDLDQGAFAESAAFARIFATLTDRLLGEDLLAPRAVAFRPEVMTGIAPRELGLSGAPRAAPPGRASFGFAPWLLWLAVLLLAWDLFAVMRRSSVVVTTGTR